MHGKYSDREVQALSQSMMKLGMDPSQLTSPLKLQRGSQPSSTTSLGASTHAASSSSPGLSLRASTGNGFGASTLPLSSGSPSTSTGYGYGGASPMGSGYQSPLSSTSYASRTPLSSTYGSRTPVGTCHPRLGIAWRCAPLSAHSGGGGCSVLCGVRMG